MQGTCTSDVRHLLKDSYATVKLSTTLITNIMLSSYKTFKKMYKFSPFA